MSVLTEKIVTPIKNFAIRNKTAIAVGVTAAVTTAVAIQINKKSNEQLGEFLKEHDLYDEYFNAGETTQIEA